MSVLRSVLVTGARGVIGRWAVRALRERGLEVSACGRSSAAPPWLSAIRWIEADLLDVQARRRLIAQAHADALLHLAWITEHGRYWHAPENLDWVGASLDLVRLFAESGGKRVVCAGSCAEYRWTPGGRLDPHRTPLEPHTLYGACKHATHTALTAYARTSGLSFAWGRVFFVFGPGEDRRRFVPSIARPLLAGEQALCRTGALERDLLSAQAIGDAFAALVCSSAEGAFNVARGEAVALGEVARRMAALLGREALLRVEYPPPQPGQPRVLEADVRRLRDEVGWQPPTDLEAELAAVLAALREEASRG